MPVKIVTGTRLLVPQQPSYDYDPQRGIVRTDPYEGLDETNAATLMASLLSQGTAFTSRGDGRSRVIEARVMSAPLDVWQVLANEVQKSVYEHQNVIANTDGTITTAVLKNIKQAVLDNEDISATLTGNALLLFGLVFKEQNHFAFGQYVLRHTVYTTDAFGSNVSDANVEKIYTTAQLLAEVTNPFLWDFPLPGRLQTKISSIPAPAAVANYRWGWRKLPSTETTVPGNFIEITTEYWLEHWSLFDYTAL